MAHVRAMAWLLGLTVLVVCVLYPLSLWLVGQGLFRDRANGSLVVDEKGETVRLDDVTSGRWTVLHLGPAPDVPAWRAVGVPILKVLVPGSAASTDSIVDTDGALTRWLDRRGASVVALRPDGFVYAAARESEPLGAPPAGYTYITVTKSQTVSGN